MNWRLRRAAAADAPAVALVASATFLETYAGVVSGADIVAHCAAQCAADLFAHWAADPGYVVTLAEHDGTAAPIGFTALAPPDLPVPSGPESIELKRIYALLPAIGGGLGPALMARAIDDARALGRTRMLLGVHPGNARARAFYERHGFRVVGTREFRVGDARFTDPVYALEL